MSPRPLPPSRGGPSPRRRWTVPCWVPGRHADPLRAGERRHLDRRALDRLDDRDRDVHLEVVALALEDRALGDARDHVQVAGRAAAAAGLALAGQPHAAAVAHARRDVHLVALDLARLAAAVAGRARVLDLGAGAAADAARLRDREEALRLGLDAAALAGRADRRASCRASRRCRGRSGTAPRAARSPGPARPRPPGRTRRAPRSRGRGRARGGCARRPCAAAAAAEEVGQDVAEAAEAARCPGRNEPGSKPPKRPPWSYCLRFSGSDRIEYASWTSLKRSSACLSPGFLSGWYWRASLR